MPRAIATRVILPILAFGAAYAVAWIINEARGTSASSAQDGRRVQLATQPRTYSKFGFSICEYWGAGKIPADIVARTPFRDAKALDRYLQKNMRGFEALRRELNPFILRAITDAHRCFAERESGDGPKAKIEWHIASNADVARASDFRIYKLEGGDDETRATARWCFESVFGKRTFEAARTEENGAFLQYDGLYPGFMPMFFGAKANPLTGRKEQTGEVSTVPN